MFQVIFFAYLVQTIASIIVTDPPPTSTEYNYWYDIVDPSTGDAKSQHEFREGDVVKGFYSVIDPDGTKRTVDYTADTKHGFKATVRNEPALHSTIAKRHYITPFPTFVPSPHIESPLRNIFPYPVPYARRLEVPIFSTNRFTESGQTNYFFPANETSPNKLKLTFNKGEFFIPNYLNN